MLADGVSSSVLSVALESELEALRHQLLGFNGHRSVWLDEAGGLWHAEPDEMLEDLGHRYVGTFFRPGVEDLAAAVRGAVTPARVAPTFGATPMLEALAIAAL